MNKNKTEQDKKRKTRTAMTMGKIVQVNMKNNNDDNTHDQIVVNVNEVDQEYNIIVGFDNSEDKEHSSEDNIQDQLEDNRN